jgi:hypothetical protein
MWNVPQEPLHAHPKDRREEEEKGVGAVRVEERQ